MSTSFSRLVELMARLRAPDGCPWDRKQTHASLKPYLLEETYEVLETIDAGHPEHLREELGDVLLQVLFHAQIASESGTFTIEDVLSLLADKLVRRHPHVFGADKAGAATADEVLAKWEDIKKAERVGKGQAAGGPDAPRMSVLDGVPKTLPALLRAYQLQARAARVGFDWPHTQDGADALLKKVEEEAGELREALRAAGTSSSAAPPASSQIEDEMGDLLFAVVNVARRLTVNPEDALRRTIDRFCERFRYIESRAVAADRQVDTLSLAEMDAWWEEAKRRPAAPATKDVAHG